VVSHDEVLKKSHEKLLEHKPPSPPVPPSPTAAPVRVGIPSKPASSSSRVAQTSDQEAPPDAKLKAPASGASFPIAKVGLDRAQVVQGLDSVGGAVARCGARFPGVTIAASVTVSPAGGVASVTVEGSPDAKLTTCVTTSLQSAHFAATRVGGSFRKPFHF